MKTPLERAATSVEHQYKRNPEAVQLAKLASLAVRVESHLLRRLRLELLPDADVGIEADLWFGPLVESRGVRAIVLNRYVVELLREKLAEDRQLLQRVIALTEQAHADSAKTIRLEERLNALAVLNEPDVRQQIDEALRPALLTMQLGGDDARQLAQWAIRALSQAHRTVRESPNAIALGLSATLALGGRPTLQEARKVTGGLGDMTWLLRGAISGSPARIGVELVAGGVAFAEPGGEQPQLDLPATNPLLLSLAWKAKGGDTTILVEAAPGRTVELDADVTEVSLRTLSGDEYLLSAVSTEQSPAPTTSEVPEARHFEIDVFISYAHLDNQPLSQQEGWVTMFHERLSALLSQRMGREVKTWMDQKLVGGGELFNEEAIAQFSKTAVMVSVLSPAYVSSAWCMSEVVKFCEFAEETGGLVVDNRSRVIKVIKTPIEFELMRRLPPGLRDTLGYEFFDSKNDDIPQSFDPNHGMDSNQKFFRKIGDVADDIAQLLLRLSAGPRPQTPARKHSGIFISYRREDSAGHAGRLFDKLVDHFGEDRIFMDVASVEAGQDLAETIENAVDSCAIVIVIIGQRWLSERLNNPNDMVRLEITRALRRDIPVIPVLVQGAHMPYRQGLPHDLIGLTERQAIELSDHSWRANVNELISGIEQHLAKSEKPVWRDSDVPESDETRRTIQSYEQQLEVALQAGDRKSESLALHNLGAAYAELGEMRRAVEFFEQAFVIHREMGERLGESSALSNLGLAYANLGDTRRAIEYFEQALAINREMGERRGESSALINLGTAYTDLGEPRRAIEYFDQALQIHRELGDRVSEGSALSHLGITYADLGEPRHAVEFFQQALLIDRELGEPGSEGADLSNISMALAQMGDRFQAIKYAELALEIFEKIEDPKAAKVRAQLAAWRDQANT